MNSKPVLLISVILGLCIFWGCEGLTEPKDTEPPEITIQTPVNNSTVTLDGANYDYDVTITTSVIDNEKVSSVECYVDGELLGTKTTSPFTWTWYANDVDKGYHTITIKAVDDSDNEAEETIQVYVQTSYFVWFWNFDVDFYAKIEFGEYQITAGSLDDTKLEGVIEDNYYFSIYVYGYYIGSDYMDVKANTWFSLYWDSATESWWYLIEYTGGAGRTIGSENRIEVARKEIGINPYFDGRIPSDYSPIP